jgi:DNA-binding NarL/FixJ family response regulator
MMKIEVLLADDHLIFLEAFKKLVESRCCVVGTASDGQTLISLAEKLRPELIIADINMPQLNGLDACERLLKKLPLSKIIFLTVDEDVDTAREAIRRGASGYLLKKSPPNELFAAIDAVMAGRLYMSSKVSGEPIKIFLARGKSPETKERLTARQREVLQLLAEGKSMKEAADVLRITVRTIAFHKYAMMQHLGMTRNSQLVLYAAQTGLCPDHAQ